MMSPMGNQQERSFSIEWAAGLITGEGHFGFLVWNKRHDRTIIFPVFQLSMKDERTIDSFQRTLAENGVPTHRSSAPSVQKAGMHRIAIRGHKRIHRLCAAVMPYLGGDKYDQANLVYEFVTSRLSRANGDPYTEEEIELVVRSRALGRPSHISVKKDPMRALQNRERNKIVRKSSETNTLS